MINESSITIEYTFEEHELLNSVLIHAMDSSDLVLYGAIHDLPEDSEIRIRYELLDSMRRRSVELWSSRFNKQTNNV